MQTRAFLMVLVGVTVCLSAESDVIADDPSVELRQNAEQLEKAGDYLACGHAYRDLVDVIPDRQLKTTVLYNAGVCFERAGEVRLAIEQYRQLGKKFRGTQLSGKALLRLGSLYETLTEFQLAAQSYELYAKLYTNEKGSLGAIGSAWMYRKSLGEFKQAIVDLEFIARTYRGHRKSSMLAIADIYFEQNDTKKALKAYQTYIQTPGKRGIQTPGKLENAKDRAQLLIAYAKIGEILWKQSCPVASINGVCARALPQRPARKAGALPTRCGPDSRTRIAVVKRRARRVAEAKKHWSAVMSLAKNGAIDNLVGKRKSDAAYWLSATQFYRLGKDYETFLSMGFPAGLDFPDENPKKMKKSIKRFSSWLEQKTKRIKALRQGYSGIRDARNARNPHWAIASVAREGELLMSFSTNLQTAEIPKTVRNGKFVADGIDAFCHGLTSNAAPLEEAAIAVFGFCLDLSTQLNFPNHWTIVCEAKRHQLRPAEYPLSNEVRDLRQRSTDVISRESLSTNSP